MVQYLKLNTQSIDHEIQGQLAYPRLITQPSLTSFLYLFYHILNDMRANLYTDALINCLS